MAKLTVLAGDFPSGVGSLFMGTITFPPDFPKNAKFLDLVKYRPESVALDSVTEVEIASEENIKKISGTVGWGVVGGVVLGPVGLLAGLLLGGKAKDTTFTVKFDNGKRMLVTANHDIYKQFIAKSFK